MPVSHIACADVLDYPDPCEDREQINKKHEDVPSEEKVVKVETKYLQLDGIFSRQGLDSLRVLRESDHSDHYQ